MSTTGRESGDFHQTNNAPVAAQIAAARRGIALAKNAANANTPAKSESFPVTKPGKASFNT